MKTLVGLVVGLGLCATAVAAEINCNIIDELNPPHWPKEQIRVQANLRAVETIDYIHKIPNDDDTFHDKEERLFSRTLTDPFNRGGIKIASCGRDLNEISEFTGISIDSDCMIAGTEDRLSFRFTLLMKEGGKLSLRVFDKDGITRRTIKFSDCK